MEAWIFDLATRIVRLPGHAKWEEGRDDIARLIEDEVFEQFGRADKHFTPLSET